MEVGTLSLLKIAGWPGAALVWLRPGHFADTERQTVSPRWIDDSPLMNWKSLAF
jgi:hypothetical protein